jgi:hypothetical protein
MRSRLLGLLVIILAVLAGCSHDRRPAGHNAAASSTASASPDAPATASAEAGSASPEQPPPPEPGPAPGGSAGNPDGGALVPAEGQAEDTSAPTQVIGNGTPASCTSDAVVSAVAAGGIITFNCGPAPVTITMTETAKIVNANGPRIVLDGGGRVTLSGGGQHRILYMNTCDKAQGWTTSHCWDQDHPQLTIQNLTFVDGNATGQPIPPDAADFSVPSGGGAIFVRGGRLKVVNSTFLRSRCDPTGPDLGGAAIRVLDQSEDRPVYIVSSTFGGAPGQGGECANGGALASIGVSWEVLNSVISYNSAIGWGANPARDGTPGGGSGGAIYTDGDQFTVHIAGSIIEHNNAVEGGGGVFFVSNDRTGTMSIEDTVWRDNPSEGFETSGYPGIFFLGASPPAVIGPPLSR